MSRDVLEMSKPSVHGEGMGLSLHRLPRSGSFRRFVRHFKASQHSSGVLGLGQLASPAIRARSPRTSCGTSWPVPWCVQCASCLTWGGCTRLGDTDVGRDRGVPERHRDATSKVTVAVVSDGPRRCGDSAVARHGGQGTFSFVREELPSRRMRDQGVVVRARVNRSFALRGRVGLVPVHGSLPPPRAA